MSSFPVLCGGCGLAIAVSLVESPLRNRVYCSELCVAQPACSADEFRDDLILTLARHVSVASISVQLGVSRSAIHNRIAAYKVLDIGSVLA